MITSRHTLHNDLSQKIIYIFVIVEQKHLTFTDSVVGETLAHGSYRIRQVLLFDNNKDI